MKYVECKVLKPDNLDTINNPSVNHMDTVYLFSCDTKDEDVEKLPKEIQERAFMVTRTYITDTIFAYKWKHRTSMSTGCVAWHINGVDDYRRVVGTKYPVALCE